MQKITHIKDPHAKRAGFGGSIRQGDITKWAKGTVHFQRPEPKNKPAKFRPVASLDSLGFKPAAIQHDAKPLVMIASMPSPKKDEEGCDGMDAVAISNRLNALLFKS